MNWYKISQTYEDIMQNPKEYEEDLESQRYFSIGQNETQDQSFCWMWINNQLRIEQGGTHNINFGHLIKDIDHHYRGWYDSIQELISVVPPVREKIIKFTKNLPSTLKRSLYRKFSENAEIVIFD